MFYLNIPVKIGFLFTSTVYIPKAFVSLPVIPAVATLKTKALSVSLLKKFLNALSRSPPEPNINIENLLVRVANPTFTIATWRGCKPAVK